MGKLHNGELNNFSSSPNIIVVIKSRRMKQAGHEIGIQNWTPRLTWKKTIKTDLVGCQESGLDLPGLGQAPVAGSCENLGSINSGKFASIMFWTLSIVLSIF
jgi:hypothetical protein